MIGYLYEGLGNTFIITENIKKEKLSKLAFLNCNKNQIDGLINYDELNNKMSIYNQDGSKALMCGNGIRCLFYHLWKQNPLNQLNINTDAGIKEIKFLSSSPFLCKVNLGRPRIIHELNSIQNITIENETFHINSIFLTTFQIVIIVDDISSPKIKEHAEKIFLYDQFKKKCNITFCELVSYHTIKTKTYERGVGFTSSCGSGAASGAYICYLLYNLSSHLKVIQDDGELIVDIDHDVFLSGPATFIKEIDLDE